MNTKITLQLGQCILLLIGACCFSFLRCSFTFRRHNVHSGQCLTQPLLKSLILLHRKLFQTLAMGQGLALLICGTAISSQYLATNFRVNTPMLQSFFNYALLCLTYTSMLLCRRGVTHHDSSIITIIITCQFTKRNKQFISTVVKNITMLQHM